MPERFTASLHRHKHLAGLQLCAFARNSVALLPFKHTACFATAHRHHNLQPIPITGTLPCALPYRIICAQSCTLFATAAFSLPLSSTHLLLSTCAFAPIWPHHLHRLPYLSYLAAITILRLLSRGERNALFCSCNGVYAFLSRRTGSRTTLVPARAPWRTAILPPGQGAAGRYVHDIGIL